MIRTIISGSPELQVSPSELYFWPVGTNGLVGQLRLNPSSRQVEAFDGAAWQLCEIPCTINLLPSASDAIRWATNKMREEAEFNDKLLKCPALRAAYEQFKLVELLSTGEDSNA